MSTIDPNSTAALNKILEKIGVKSNDDTSSLKKKDTLGQSDFLKLMTTQLQNQDPFSPMENGDFIAQMAQFSTVTGIAEMGESTGPHAPSPLSGEEFKMELNIYAINYNVLRIMSGMGGLAYSN